MANVTVSGKNPYTAYDVVLSFAPSASLSIVGSGSTFYVGDLVGNVSKSFTFTVGAEQSASSGTFPLGYTLNFHNSTGAVLVSTGQVYVTISGTPARPLLVSSQVILSQTPVTPGTDFTAAVLLNNTGSTTAYGGVLVVSPGSGLSLVSSSGTVSLRTLAPHQVETVTFGMSASSSLPSSFVPVLLDLSYTDSNGLHYFTNSTFNVQLAARPDVRVGSFALSVAPLRPGVSSVLSLSLLNVGGDRAYDVKVTLSGPFFIGGNTVNYLGAIASGGSASTSFFFSVPGGMAPGNYVIGVGATYTDQKGTQYAIDSNYTVTVAAYVAPSVTITNTILDPPVLTPGTSGTLTIFLKNSGATEARNLQIRISGGNGIVSSDYFGLGTLAPGASVTQVVGINVDPKLAPGSYLLMMNATFEDPSGATYTSSTPLQSNVYHGTNLFSLFNLAVVAVLVLIAAAVIVALRRYRVV
jgi:hypothetical protein